MQVISTFWRLWINMGAWVCLVSWLHWYYFLWIYTMYWACLCCSIQVFKILCFYLVSHMVVSLLPIVYQLTLLHILITCYFITVINCDHYPGQYGGLLTMVKGGCHFPDDQEWWTFFELTHWMFVCLLLRNIYLDPCYFFN